MSKPSQFHNTMGGDSWSRHLRADGKRAFWKAERKAAQHDAATTAALESIARQLEAMQGTPPDTNARPFCQPIG